MSALSEILKILKDEKKEYNYHIPNLWLNKPEANTIKVKPSTYFSEIIDTILLLRKDGINYNRSISLINSEKHKFPGDWTINSSIYNIFTRLTTAFDHNNDGEIGGSAADITLNNEGIRETGTFLKSIAILPYLKELGINTIHLLPITSIGSDGNKGDLGSPYAVKNQYRIDNTLADPLIYLPVEDQFRAFVQAAHILGIRVVLEFVFRTASKDADWINNYPDWFYWIDKSKAKIYKSPEFTEEELLILHKIPEGKAEYIPPHKKYRDIFKKPPTPEQIKYKNGKYVANTEEGELIIPGAFADWPPDDIQPPWGDVTYLRMYNYPFDKQGNYNYIAYNTIRYYAPELAKPENANLELWAMIKNIIPHYQEQFGIDGVMIDMGHALPSELKQQMIKAARDIDPDFAFWDENFAIKQSSRDDGYNAVIGYSWAVTHQKDGMRNLILDSAKELPLPFFGGPESHNTHRAVNKKGGIEYSKLAWTVNNFIPSSIPFLHGGFELGETFPVNTGLNFTQEELAYYKDKKLPLFYKSSYNWLNQNNIVDFIKKIAVIRENYKDLITNNNPDSIKILETGNENIIAFERISESKKITIILNTNFDYPEKGEILSDNQSAKDLLSDKILKAQSGKLFLELDKAEVLIFIPHNN